MPNDSIYMLYTHVLIAAGFSFFGDYESYFGSDFF